MLVSRPRWVSAAAPLAIAATLFVSQTSAAQRRQQLPAGTAVPVRTSAAINVNSADGQVHTGVVDENVLRNVGYDPEEFSGFAFGWGLERIFMLRHGLTDIRMLWQNDLRLLDQF